MPVPRPVVTRQAVEAWRDRAFRRLPRLKVRGERSALRFVNDVGFCFTLSDFGLPVASLYVAVCGRRHPRWPKHTHHDPEIGLTWDLKDRLPAKRLTYYGKLLKGKPTLVSLGLLPAFCALIRDGKGSGDYIVDYRQGRMSRAAVAILEALHDASPLATPDLRKAVMMRDPDRGAEFDRAMAELQRGLWIVKVEEVYDPDFYYRWDLLDNWLPGPVEASLDLPRDEAVRRLVAAYLRSAAASQPRFLAGLFGLEVGGVEAALRWLEAKGQIRRDQRVKGLPGSWVIWKGLGSATTDERR
ncbi:MAG: winged helix DNA-binding domain-containing protein [candidate division NC10 bacterium]|nr:winged helix DNA-binding domain-containing protein [candidate division NC10 bacterium]